MRSLVTTLLLFFGYAPATQYLTDQGWFAKAGLALASPGTLNVDALIWLLAFYSACQAACTALEYCAYGLTSGPAYVVSSVRAATASASSNDRAVSSGR